MDEARFAVALNDVDYCLRLREAGKRILFTPHAKLVHAKSASRGTTIAPIGEAGLNMSLICFVRAGASCSTTTRLTIRNCHAIMFPMAASPGLRDDGPLATIVRRPRANYHWDFDEAPEHFRTKHVLELDLGMDTGSREKTRQIKITEAELLIPSDAESPLMALWSHLLASRATKSVEFRQQRFLPGRRGQSKPIFTARQIEPGIGWPFGPGREIGCRNRNNRFHGELHTARLQSSDDGASKPCQLVSPVQARLTTPPLRANNSFQFDAFETHDAGNGIGDRTCGSRGA